MSDERSGGDQEHPPIFRPPPPPVRSPSTARSQPDAPVEPTAPPATAPVQWAPVEASDRQAGLAGWALVFAIAGLAFSFFVGWAFPLGLTGIVLAVLALRRPAESRVAAVWALCLGAVSVLYSVGWLLWAGSVLA